MTCHYKMEQEEGKASFVVQLSSHEDMGDAALPYRERKFSLEHIIAAAIHTALNDMSVERVFGARSLSLTHA